MEALSKVIARHFDLPIQTLTLDNQGTYAGQFNTYSLVALKLHKIDMT